VGAALFVIIDSTLPIAPFGGYDGSFGLGRFSFHNKPTNEWSAPGLFDAGISAGSTVSGWTVERGNVGYVGALWKDAEGGSGSIDLNGTPGEGAISWSHPSHPGHAYRLSFWMSGNPGMSSEPALKKLRVSGGKTVARFECDVSLEQNSYTDMKWRKKEFQYIATDYMTKVEFASESGDINTGPVIDLVDLQYLGSPELSIAWIDQTHVKVIFSTCYELRYQIQTRTSVNEAWVDAGSHVKGDGTIQAIDVTVEPASARFFRVALIMPPY